MLEAILDPFDRPSGHPRRNAHQHDRDVKNELHAEGAAGIGSRPDAQAIARHAQRACHHRVQRERTLKIRERIVAILVPEIFRDHRKAFHRRDGIARKMNGQLGAVGRAGEGAGNIAMNEIARSHDVGADLWMQHRSSRCDRGDGIDDGRQWPIFDLQSRRAHPRRDSGPTRERPPPARRQSVRDRLPGIGIRAASSAR